MKRDSIPEAKNGRSTVAGAAPLDPVSRSPAVLEDERLMRLVRDGLVRPARSTLPKDLFSVRPPVPQAGVSAVSALLDERRQGR